MHMARPEGTGLGGKIAIGVGVLLLLAAAGLAIYGGTITPKQHMVEKVLPNERFAQ